MSADVRIAEFCGIAVAPHDQADSVKLEATCSQLALKIAYRAIGYRLYGLSGTSHDFGSRLFSEFQRRVVRLLGLGKVGIPQLHLTPLQQARRLNGARQQHRNSPPRLDAESYGCRVISRSLTHCVRYSSQLSTSHCDPLDLLVSRGISRLGKRALAGRAEKRYPWRLPRVPGGLMSATENVFHESALGSTPIRNLGLTLTGTALEPVLAGFLEEVRNAGIVRLKPRFYLSTEWGVPFDTIAIAIPFYLARPELTAIHAERA